MKVDHTDFYSLTLPVVASGTSSISGLHDGEFARGNIVRVLTYPYYYKGGLAFETAT